jgi:hypothetical protein
VLEVLRHLALAMPSPFPGAIGLELVPRAAGAALTVQIDSGPSFLPFPIDLQAVARDAAPLLGRHGVRFERARDAELRLLLPAAGAVSTAAAAGGAAQVAAES